MNTIITMHFQILKSTNYKLKIIWAIILLIYPFVFVAMFSVLPTLNTNNGGNHRICFIYYTYTFFIMYLSIGRQFFSDSKNTFNKFISSTPINFSTALAGQYVSFLIASLLTVVYSVVSLAVSCKLLSISVTVNNLMLSFILPVSAFLLMASIHIPLTLKIGTKNAYIITVFSVSFIVIFGFIYLIITIKNNFMQSRSKIFPELLFYTLTIFPFLPFIIGTLIYIISKKKNPMIYTN